MTDALSGAGAGEDPSTRRWADAAEHVATYRSTGGAVGHTWHGRPHLLLSTTGRRSGLEHTVPLVYARLPGALVDEPDGHPDGGGRLVVVASAGGAERHPAWYLNLEADHEVGVQLLDHRWRARARTAVGAEEEQGWQALVRTWAGFAVYRRETARRIPVVVLPSHG